jgi:hypothetical protein
MHSRDNNVHWYLAYSEYLCPANCGYLNSLPMVRSRTVVFYLLLNFLLEPTLAKNVCNRIAFYSSNRSNHRNGFDLVLFINFIHVI